MAGAPIAAHPALLELCTPTGAALLTTIATGWGPPPAAVPTAVGVGAGSRDPAGHPNIIRVLLGQDSATAPQWATTDLHRIDTTIDDLDPRIWPDLLEQLRVAGAADAWCTPALMRKGRPGHVLSVLSSPAQLDMLCTIIFEQTTTLGVRISAVQRRSLTRDQIEVSAADTVIRVKRGFLAGRLVTLTPEYDDVAAAAHASGQPVHQIMAQVRRQASPHRHPATDPDTP
jgi:uncharacterized protein (DUF111 family)